MLGELHHLSSGKTMQNGLCDSFIDCAIRTSSADPTMLIPRQSVHPLRL